MTIFKMRLNRVSEDTIEVVCFFGEEGQTLQNAGTLRLRVGEYQVFGAALLIGQEKMVNHFRSIVEGEAEALRAEYYAPIAKLRRTEKQ